MLRTNKTKLKMFPHTSSKKDWTTENLDWKKLAIMVNDIITEGKLTYHENTIGRDSHAFLLNLFDEGNVEF